MSLIEKLPEEILLQIFKPLTSQDLKNVKQTCTKFRDVIIGNTVRLDFDSLSIEGFRSNQDMASYILKCRQLRTLILVDFKDVASIPFFDDVLKQKKMFAKDLSIFCPEIRCFEVASMTSLQMVKDYAKYLGDKNVIREVRLYATNSRQVYHLMLAINRLCPKLKIFKFLRRRHPSNYDPCIEFMFPKLWTEMAPKLTGFSTNVMDRGIISPAITTLINLKRLVIWNLNEDEMRIVVENCKQLRILIFISSSPLGLHYIKDLPFLEEFTVTLPLCVKDWDVGESFQTFFESVGPQLKKLTLGFGGGYISDCLEGLPSCLQLNDLKLKDMEDNLSDLFADVKKLTQLKTLTLQPTKDLEDPESINLPVEGLFKECQSLQRCFLPGKIFIRSDPHKNSQNSEKKLKKEFKQETAEE